jgi:hypothetical protein
MVKEMINKTDLLDPASLSGRSDREKKVIADAQNAGNGPAVRNAEDTGGVLRQTVSPEAIKADETGAPGGDSDLSGGIANLDETAGKLVHENEYNR